MYVLIERFMERLNDEQIRDFAYKNNIILKDDEVAFIKEFLQKNWRLILSNHGVVDISRYKEKFSEENFSKIQKLIKEYTMKYANYL